MTSKNFKILHKAFLEKTVEHLKPRPAHALPLAASMHDALRAFEMSHAGSVVILDDDLALKGIFTERDLLFKYQPGTEASKIPISSVMTTPVQSISARASVARLLHMIALGGFRHVPVTAKADEAPRILSVRNLVDFLYKSVAKDLVGGGAKAGRDFDEIMVKDFFAAPISMLQPVSPIWIGESVVVFDALDSMRSHGVGSLLVKSSAGALLGIFTERDFRTRVAVPGRITTRTKVSEVMTATPVCIDAKANVALAFQLMSEGGYRSVPVTGKDGTIEGLLSTHGLIAALTASVVEELSQHGR